MVKLEMSLLLYMMNFSTPPNKDDKDAINKNQNVVEVDSNSDFLGKIIERITKFEPENALRFTGMLLLHFSDEELYQFAYGPEYRLYFKISFIKAVMGIQTKMNVSAQAGIGIQNKVIHPQSLPTPFLNPHQTVRKRTNRKSCYFHAKGICMHGNSCLFSHASISPDDFYYHNAKEHRLTAGLLDRVEMKITGILKAMRGQPVSITSLPMLYYERYGRHILADAYLTESQRYENVTELLSQFRNSIRLIERPDGQHLVILAEDAPKYIDHGNERIDSGSIGSSSHQIHLTFLADSLFTAKDVVNHFNSKYRLVRSVRIHKAKWMFGYVRFDSAETVNNILSDRKTQIICGNVVGVEREPKVSERKRTNKMSCYYHAKGILKVEMKITDILKAMRGQPVSITSLPMLYYERYGRHILADAYLTENQRYGNVTELLSQFRNNSIQLIERPDGQHLVILAEDATKDIDHGNERIDFGSIGSSSHQIRLTFLADSLFTAEDVAKHFSSKYGLVRTVWIHKEKWMFGYVSFDSAETVNNILSGPKTQVICGNVVGVAGKPKVSERILKEQEQEKKVESKQSPH